MYQHLSKTGETQKILELMLILDLPKIMFQGIWSTQARGIGFESGGGGTNSMMLQFLYVNLRKTMFAASKKGKVHFREHYSP